MRTPITPALLLLLPWAAAATTATNLEKDSLSTTDATTTTILSRWLAARQLPVVSAPIEMMDMAEFAVALSPYLERTLQSVLDPYDPYPMDETVTQTFEDVDIGSVCPIPGQGTMDATAEITIVQVAGISSLEMKSLSVDGGSIREDLPHIHWRGDFTLETVLTEDLVATVDVRLTAQGCSGFIDVDETMEGVLVTLEDPTVDLTTYLKGHVDTMTTSVSVDEASVTAMDLQVSGVSTSGLGILETYVPSLAEEIEGLIIDSIDTYIEPLAQQAINDILDANLPIAVTV